MPQNELLDLLYECFKKHRYWSLKSLKHELNQPEAYLKSTLEMIAHLIRQGTFAMLWELKPGSMLGNYDEYTSMKDEVAPDRGYDGATEYKDFGDDDEEDNNVKMEDVLPI